MKLRVSPSYLNDGFSILGVFLTFIFTPFLSTGRILLTL